MIGAIFQSMGQVITQFASALGNVFKAIEGFFFGAEGQLTFVGTLIIIAATTGLVYWGIRLIMRLLNRA